MRREITRTDPPAPSAPQEGDEAPGAYERKPLATTLPRFTPVPRKKNRADGWTVQRQRLFIEALADSGSVKSAALAVGKTPETAYQLRRHPEAASFRKAWEAALDLGVQRIEDVAMERALNGVEEPVFYHGEQAGMRRAYNDQLLMFMLRNRAPLRFTDGNARAMSAMDEQKLKRLKRQWRAEWEEEQAAESEISEAELIHSLNMKIEALAGEDRDRMSPETRRLYDAFLESERRDRESGYAWMKEARGAAPEEGGGADAAAGEAPEGAAKLLADGRGVDGADVGEARERVRVRTVKDGGW